MAQRCGRGGRWRSRSTTWGGARTSCRAGNAEKPRSRVDRYEDPDSLEAPSERAYFFIALPRGEHAHQLAPTGPARHLSPSSTRRSPPMPMPVSVADSPAPVIIAEVEDARRRGAAPSVEHLALRRGLAQGRAHRALVRARAAASSAEHGAARARSNTDVEKTVRMMPGPPPDEGLRRHHAVRHRRGSAAPALHPGDGRVRLADEGSRSERSASLLQDEGGRLLAGGCCRGRWRVGPEGDAGDVRHRRRSQWEIGSGSSRTPAGEGGASAVLLPWASNRAVGPRAGCRVHSGVGDMKIDYARKGEMQRSRLFSLTLIMLGMGFTACRCTPARSPRNLPRLHQPSP